MPPVNRLLCVLLALLAGRLLPAQERPDGSPSAGAIGEARPPAPNVNRPALPGRDSARVTPVVQAVHEVLPSVVNISTKRLVRQGSQRLNSIFALHRKYFGEVVESRPSLGSGVIVDASGLVLTNDHVIRQASEIVVALTDGRQFEAVPVATDVTNDLCLLRLVPPEDRTIELRAIDFSVPGDLVLAEKVIAVGNPFGFGHSVTTGILSATGRRAVRNNKVIFDDILQTDAAINPGNSGGPLINADGQLIGINQAIQADAQGIGFAIPVERVEQLLGLWLLPSRFSACSLGLVPETAIAEDGQPFVRVRELLAESPAAASGLQPGARIEALNGQPVRQAIDASRILWRLRAGDELAVGTPDGTVTIDVAEVKVLSGEELAAKLLRVELQAVTPRVKRALRLPYYRGLIITKVAANSDLAKAGIRRGDVIIQVGQTPIRNLADLHQALSQLHHGDTVELQIDRFLSFHGIIQQERYTIELTF